MSPPLILGWEEWVALPALGLGAIKAKIDTGARTSALHAHLIEPFGPPERPMVRFLVHPAPGRDGLEIACEAPLAEYREVEQRRAGDGDAGARLLALDAAAAGLALAGTFTAANAHAVLGGAFARLQFIDD